MQIIQLEEAQEGPEEGAGARVVYSRGQFIRSLFAFQPVNELMRDNSSREWQMHE